VGPVIGACILGYFAYHAVHGQRGLFALMALEKKVITANIEAKKIKETLKTWENRVALLHPSKIDPDMLEERVREMLNFGHINDVVFIIQDKNWNS